MLPAISPNAQNQIQPIINKMIQDETGQLSTYPFPPNVAELIPKEIRQKIFDWMLKTYIWPQVMERKPFEKTWDKLLDMARASWKYSDLDVDDKTRLARKKQSRILDSRGNADGDNDSNINTQIDVADTVIFDAVDRLTNLNHFIAFKEEMPVRYEVPVDMIFPYENDVYSPMSDFTRAANGWLRFNFQGQSVYRKHWMTARHHYTYGISLVSSEFIQKIDFVPRRMPDRSFQNIPELTDIGVQFEPMSLRKLWLNYRISVYNMDYQPCPFFFEEIPRFAIVANKYDQGLNPMGFGNLESLPKGDWLFNGSEMESAFSAIQKSYPNSNVQLNGLMPPEFNVELLWTFYPMLPLQILPPQNPNDPQSQPVINFETDAQGNPIPLQRYIFQSFGNNLVNGSQEIIRLQRNFYPRDSIPLYGSAHMPTLDDGAYSPAIGTVLEGHYRQICKALMQFLENKDWNNDPPIDIQVGSPSMTRTGLNDKGARNPVNGPNDIRRREPFDGGGTTIQFLQYAREQAQTSSKSTDAILGKAMGSRTTATEAGNVYQTAMSGVTTDVNLFTHDIMGGYATRVWEYTGLWVDPDILAAVTGSYGFVIKPEHLRIRLGLKWDTGSQFIESITRQNNIQYLLQACPPGDPTLNRAYLFEELLTEWKFKNINRIVNDQGMDEQIMLANDEATRTYLGELVMVDPDMDHQVAIKVLKSYLKDRNSYWNTNPQTVQRGAQIVQLIQQHMQWFQLQQLQMQLQQQRQLLGSDPTATQPLQPPNPSAPSPGSVPTNGGQQRQQTGK